MEALEEKEFEPSAAKDQTQEEAFATLKSSHIAEEKIARWEVLHNASVSLYLELIWDNAGYLASEPIKGVLKGSLKQTHISLETWLKAKMLLRKDALRFMQDGNPLVIDYDTWSKNFTNRPVIRQSLSGRC